MTIEIQLAKGYTTIIDDEDADLSRIQWGTLGKTRVYARKGVWSNKKVIDFFLHRIIAERVFDRIISKGEEVDHINGDTLDNRRINLRIVTRAQNMWNRKLNKNNKSGYKGVSKDGNLWRAAIQKNKQRITLGWFKTPKEAHEAYCKAAAELFGEFARFE